MKPRFYPFWIIAIVAVLLLHPVLNVFGGDILYEDDFTNLDPSWGTPGDILSVKEGKLVLKPALNTTQSVLNLFKILGVTTILEIQGGLSQL